MKKGEISIGLVSETRFPDEGIIYRDDGKVKIKHCIPHQLIEYMITRKKEGNAKGRMIRVVEKSPLENVETPCIHSGICGGCLYQTVGYENQLKIKEEQILTLLKNATKDEFIWEGIKASPFEIGYRNKMEYSFGDEYKDGPLALGMHKRGSHYDIVTTDECKIVHEDFTQILKTTLEFFRNKNIPYFHKNTHLGVLRHLIIRRSVYNKELLINLVTTTQLGSEFEEVLRDWKEEILKLDSKIEAKVSGILHTKNDSLADAVIDEGMSILYGNDFIVEKLLGLEFKISTFSFFQTNSLGAEVLYSVAGEYIGDTKGKSVYDLYSGTGTIAQLLAKFAEEVYGVEIVEEAVDAARENAVRNGILNCKFIAGDVLKIIDDLDRKPDIIILDPPRDGVHPKALPKIIDFNAEKIVYISCKPSSLARDMEVLNAGGYHMVKACTVDMFPFTGNVETVALLSKLDVDKHIDVEIKLDELDLTSAESKASYAQIKEYILEKFDLKVSTLYIAQIKKKCGIVLREHYNKSKKEKQVIPQCTPEKEEAIMDALRHFKMI